MPNLASRHQPSRASLAAALFAIATAGGVSDSPAIAGATEASKLVESENASHPRRCFVATEFKQLRDGTGWGLSMGLIGKLRPDHAGLADPA